LAAAVRGPQVGHPQEHLEITLYLVLLLLQVVEVLEVLEILMRYQVVQVVELKVKKLKQVRQVFLAKEMLEGLQMALLVQQAVVVLELSELAQHQQVVEVAVQGLRVPSVER
jgi:hypothetical protein